LREKILNLGEKVIKNKDSRGIECDDQGAGDEADGVENVHDLKSHHARHKRKHKNTVPEPSEGLIVKALKSLLFSEENSVEKIDGGTHGAEPSTKEIAKNENAKEHPEGRKHSQDNFLLGEKCNDPDKGIEPKVEVHRNFQFKGKGSLDDEIEEEEKRKGLNRPPQVGDRFFHAAVTFFTRTFERLIWPRPKS
jgi:hypothetical protein